MRVAFRDGDIAGLRKAYADGRKRNPFLKGTLWLIERFYPVSGMLEMAEYIDREISSSGLGDASRKTLERIRIDWESQLPEGSDEIIRSAPVIFYGNHPSMLTPFLIAAGVDRPDFRILMISYVGHLIPSLSRLILPLELPLNRPLTELLRGGLKHLLALWLVSRLHSVPQRALAKAINRRSLEAAVEHVRSGGCVAIFPAGGGRANRRWYPGIGTLVKELVKSSADRPIYLVPIREYNSTNHRVYASVSSSRAARIRRRILYRRPVRIEFAEPIRLDRLPIDPSSAHRIASWLKRHYDGLFPLPRSA
ncbi:hypothetical protein DRJ24_03635 [Candidatus Acetothermia bacterium]|nr:MAG: hypothetical protein DRJ24_03635 [Candidatus Acetothermia bacterium]